MGEKAHVDFGVSPVVASGFIRYIGGAWNISIEENQFANSPSAKVDLHIHCIQLIPGIMVVHAVLVIYCTSSMPPISFGILLPLDDDAFPIVSVPKMG